MSFGKKNKIVILGGSGFIGSHLSDYLAAKKIFKVVIFDNKNKKNLKRNQKFIKGSVLNEKKLSKAIRGSDYVFNFAALADLDKAKNKPLETAMINIVGMIKILKACKIHKVKKIIQASTIYANSEQGGFYGASKKAAEDYIERFYKKYKLKYTILRFGSLYGEGANENNGINIIIDYALKNKALLYKGSNRAARKYIHVLDACKACSQVMQGKYDNKYLNITGSKTIRITKLLSILSNILNISKSKIYFNNKHNEGHYIGEPKKFVPRQGVNLNLKKHQNFKQELLKQYLERKKIYKL